LYTAAAAKKHWFMAFNKQVYRPGQILARRCRNVQRGEGLPFIGNVAKFWKGWSGHKPKQARQERSFEFSNL